VRGRGEAFAAAFRRARALAAAAGAGALPAAPFGADGLPVLGTTAPLVLLAGCVLADGTGEPIGFPAPGCGRVPAFAAGAKATGFGAAGFGAVGSKRAAGGDLRSANAGFAAEACFEASRSSPPLAAASERCGFSDALVPAPAGLSDFAFRAWACARAFACCASRGFAASAAAPLAFAPALRAAAGAIFLFTDTFWVERVAAVFAAAPTEAVLEGAFFLLLAMAVSIPSRVRADRAARAPSTLLGPQLNGLDERR
jgi:hypothetical protein